MSSGKEIIIDGNYILKLSEYNDGIVLINDGPGNLYLEPGVNEQINDSGFFLKQNEDIEIPGTIDVISFYSNSSTTFRYMFGDNQIEKSFTAENALEVINNDPDHGSNAQHDYSDSPGDVGLGNVTNDAQVKRVEMATPDGVATLDSNGKILANQLPETVMDYLGTWNASTNTPTISDGTGNSGDIYLCTTAGTQDLGSGSIDFAEGDWVIYNGSIWEKSINENIEFKSIFSKSTTLMEPDAVQGVSDAIPLFPVDSTEFDNGITVTDVLLQASSAVSSSVVIEDWSDPTTHSADIATVSLSSSTENTQTNIDTNVDNGHLLVVDLNTTDVNWYSITVFYTER